MAGGGGGYALASIDRFQPDLSFDAAFANGPVAGESAAGAVLAIAREQDGRLVTAIARVGDTANVVRLAADGAPDATFDQTGITSTVSYPAALSIGSDQEIFVAGARNSLDGRPDGSVVITRLLGGVGTGRIAIARVGRAGRRALNVRLRCSNQPGCEGQVRTAAVQRGYMLDAGERTTIRLRSPHRLRARVRITVTNAPQRPVHRTARLRRS